ncbi:MAG: hypothetical protein NE330_03355 [Lentisphaeraceae bacterium]|nr:hypothetical protein [Lentisphaeraceae bacterium]
MKKKVTIALLGIFSVVTVFHQMNLDDRLYYLLFPGNEKGGLNLGKYELQNKVVLDDIVNLSGVTYNPQTNSEVVSGK